MSNLYNYKNKNSVRYYRTKNVLATIEQRGSGKEAMRVRIIFS